ncbi:TPA: hypothetical protein ACJIWH_000437 [Yersinia enterocolitica]|nr:hypothetical protein [Yersinia enterocolitica]HDL7835246.1 hypothetical protein [Yersinia enterocolitica]HEB2006345.1 hypothetical protein [Yersinia enterocolitica]HEG1703219.1 hypothetical protein [Yersinia enterocolitica]
MTTKKTKNDDKEAVNEGASRIQEAITKTCFIIMPIADVPNYEAGHFNRVYLHLIAPACRKAGFKPIRADEVNSSNMIVLDILKKIVECDMAICDLSSRNPNVLYELGLRQAFNKKTVLIKDRITISPFDVQAFRYAEYDNSLRVDYVQNEIVSLAASIKSTYEAQDDVNSIVQLLQIEPAKIGEKTQLSTTDTIILSAIEDLTNRVDRITNKNHHSGYFSLGTNNLPPAGISIVPPINKEDIIGGIPLIKLISTYEIDFIKDNYLFYVNYAPLGRLVNFNDEDNIITFKSNDKPYRKVNYECTVATTETIVGIKTNRTDDS